MKLRLLPFLFGSLSILFSGCDSSKPALSELDRQIRDIIAGKDATVGVAVICGPDTLLINNDHPYPMLSVVKFPQAMAVLGYMERQGDELTTELHIYPEDMVPDTYSPLRDGCPEGDITLPISHLLDYSVALSDNIACDVLFRYTGGTEYVQRYIRELDFPGTVIVATEARMHEKPGNEYLNHTSPYEAARLMDRFLQGGLFAEENAAFLMHTLISTVTGPDKIRGLLPPATIVGHKTGSSSRTPEGVKIADNDVGFVMLPDGSYYTLAIFITNSREDDPANAATIALISRAVYDYYYREE